MDKFELQKLRERLFMQLQQVLPNLEHHQLPPGCKDFGDYYVAMKRKEA